MNSEGPSRNQAQLDRTALFCNDDWARAYLSRVRWPEGPECPHCGVINRAYRLQPKADSASPVRKGVWKCRDCRKQFTVTIGTVFERSRVGLATWLHMIYLMAESKKGISAMELARRLGLQYKIVFYMAHAVRELMLEWVNLEGDIEADETFIGRRRIGSSERTKDAELQSTVLTVYARDSDKVRSTVVESARTGDLSEPILDQSDTSGRLITDGRPSYPAIGEKFDRGHTVINKRGYSRAREFTSKTDSFHSTIKAALRRTYHGVSPDYLPAYLVERDWFFNHKDDDRFKLLIAAALRVSPDRALAVDYVERAASGG